MVGSSDGMFCSRFHSGFWVGGDSGGATPSGCWRDRAAAFGSSWKMLMWVSAFLMSASMYQIDAVLLREAIKQGHISLTVVAIFLAPALALWCDIALVVAAVMRKRWHELNLPHSQATWIGSYGWRPSP